MARTKIVGTDYIPPDLRAKITGKARYAEDWRADGMLFAKCLLSPMPHCRVRSIDTSAALAMEGVAGIITAEDLPEGDALNEAPLTNEPLFEGQSILALAAVDETTAADAIEKIKVDLEPLPFALDPLDSLRPGGPNARIDGNTIVRERNEEGRPEQVVKELKWTAEQFDAVGPGEMPSGEAQDEWELGDVEAGFAESEVIIEESLFFQSVTHHPMEPRSCMAYWQNGKLFIHPSTQSIMVTHAVLARQLGMSPGDVVLICEFTGGGFGSKIVGSINMAIPALLAKKTGRPVMQRISRYEENYIGRARTGFQGKIKVGWRADGRVAALDMFIVQDNGPYGRQGDLPTAGAVSTIAYQPLNTRMRGVSVLTNTPPRSAQRAPGGAQIIGMIEPLMDRAAKRLGIDRLEMRRINAPAEGAKFNGPEQQEVTTAYVREALDKLSDLVDWPAAQQLSGRRAGSKVTGVGVSLSPFTAGASGFDGLMVLRPDGRLAVHTGVGNLGTHSYSDTARVAADVLQFPWEKIDVVWGNTGKGLPNTSVQAGSMTTHSASRAIHAAASALARKAQEIAAKDLGGSADQYEVANERVYRKGASSRGMSLAKVAERAIELGGVYDGHELDEDLSGYTKGFAGVLAGQGLVSAAKDNYTAGKAVYSFVCGFAEVEIDTETGHLEIKRYAATTDCGQVMNPRSLAAQLCGGSIQGFGLARSQKWVFDPQWGIPFANRFYTARPPSMLDVPLDLKWDWVNLPDPNSPVGAKGIGEPPVGAGTAALICAIQDALGDHVFRRTPIMTDMILNAIEGRPQDVGALETNT